MTPTCSSRVQAWEALTHQEQMCLPWFGMNVSNKARIACPAPRGCGAAAGEACRPREADPSACQRHRKHEHAVAAIYAGHSERCALYGDDDACPMARPAGRRPAECDPWPEPIAAPLAPLDEARPTREEINAHSDRDFNEPCATPGCGLVAGKHVWADRYTRRIGPRCRGFTSTRDAEARPTRGELLALVRELRDSLARAPLASTCRYCIAPRVR